MQAGVTVSVPSLWLLEIANGLFKAERRNYIDCKSIAIWLSSRSGCFISSIDSCRFPTQADLKILRLYAEKHQLSAYDAEYLRVAKEQKLILASLDGNLLAAAMREKVQVVPPI